MSTHRRALLPLIIAVAAAWPTTTLYGAGAATLSLAEIAEGLEQFHERILDRKSFYVDFAIESETLIPSDSTSFVGGYRYRLGRMGGSWYTFLKGSEVEGRSVADQVWLCHGGICAHFIDGRVIKKLLVSETTESALFSRWYYTDNLFIYAYSNLPQELQATAKELHELNRYPSALPAALRTEDSRYRVLPDLEEIDGEPCHVVQWDNHDTIWIAAERGFVPLKRKIYFGHDRPKQTIDRVFTNSNLVEAQPSIWLPQQQTVEYYPDPLVETNPDIWGKVSCVRTFRVNEMAFDSLDDAFFQIQVPTGTHVQDGINNKAYVVRDITHRPFEELVQIVKAKESPLRTNWRRSAMIAANILIFAALAWLVMKNRKWST